MKTERKEKMDVKISEKDGTLHIAVFGEIDHHTAVLIREEADAAITRSRPSKLVFDLSGVTFSDSSGIAVIVGRYKKMQSVGSEGKILLKGTPPFIKKIFDMSGMKNFVEYN